jgi:hypothetical protein
MVKLPSQCNAKLLHSLRQELHIPSFLLGKSKASRKGIILDLNVQA